MQFIHSYFEKLFNNKTLYEFNTVLCVKIQGIKYRILSKIIILLRLLLTI